MKAQSRRVQVERRELSGSLSTHVQKGYQNKLTVMHLHQCDHVKFYPAYSKKNCHCQEPCVQVEVPLSDFSRGYSMSIVHAKLNV